MNVKAIAKFALPLGIVAATAVTVMLILNNPPEAKFSPPKTAARILVEVQKIERQPYTVAIDSYGTVRPRTQTSLTSQVSGQITYISENFREGGFFEKGEIMVRVDPRDYRAEVKVAEADLILAQQTLSEESARADQAKADWQRLGKKGKPNDLVLRIPQLQAAKASMLSAEAKLGIAKLALERTEIKAPFSGRILGKHVDIGQVVSANTSLADIYATDFVEVRLPIKNSDLPLLNLPQEANRQAPAATPTQVLFYSDLIGDQQWSGILVRTEGAIDSDTQQLYGVAQIDKPFDLTPPLIKIGQYVNASIIGRTLPDAIKIPNSAIYQGTFVYIEKDGLLQRRNVRTLWKNDEDALIAEGLEEGENIVLSPLGNVVSGTPVKVAGRDEPTKAEGAAQ
ncbi:efflux RND transporter periplasmic adaptor subunit [Terasakiella pusilla]|uniref:efflux RND transporter periplasmic adaptor subunit n=1 Tax=Terasakiella pusilla TaxID=64973 RepID=UPI003AA885C0